jgi:hypothetical protein
MVTPSTGGTVLRSPHFSLRTARWRCRYIESAPRGVHLVGFPHLRGDGSAATAYTFTSAKFGRMISGYYFDEFAQDDAGRLLFARREISMPVVWQPPRAQDGQR